MATNKIIQPLLNPVKFIDMDPELIPQFLSRHMDDYFYLETIKPWQTRRNYIQSWQKTDTVSIQIQSTYDPVRISLVDIDERVYFFTNFTKVLYDFDDPTLFLYEVEVPLASFGEGLYFWKIEAGDDGTGNYEITLISEPQHIAELQKDTLLLAYQHPDYYNDVVPSGFFPFIRIRATLRLKSLSSKDSFFEDQVLDMTMLQSKPFRLWQLLIGGASGIPDYLADLLNRVFGCKTLLIDGKPYTKSDGAKMEESAQPNYPMRGWSIDLREAENITSLVFGAKQHTITSEADEDLLWQDDFGIDPGGGDDDTILLE
jgi:hypothetical protein